MKKYFFWFLLLTTPLFNLTASIDEGFQLYPKIIGGQNTSGFPASIGAETCSATIISPRAVITADHCAHNFKVGPIIKAVYRNPHNHPYTSKVSQFDIAVIHYRYDKFVHYAQIDLRPVYFNEILQLVAFGYDQARPPRRSKRMGFNKLAMSPFIVDYDQRYPIELRNRDFEINKKDLAINRALHLKTWCDDYHKPEFANTAPADSGGSIYRNGKLVGVVSGVIQYNIFKDQNVKVVCESGANAPLALPENIKFLKEINQLHNLGIEFLNGEY